MAKKNEFETRGRPRSMAAEGRVKDFYKQLEKTGVPENKGESISVSQKGTRAEYLRFRQTFAFIEFCKEVRSLGYAPGLFFKDDTVTLALEKE